MNLYLKLKAFFSKKDSLAKTSSIQAKSDSLNSELKNTEQLKDNSLKTKLSDEIKDMMEKEKIKFIDTRNDYFTKNKTNDSDSAMLSR